ncbi:MAG: penicillin-binding protein [Clostridia bacterium]|nr:penicillin-binding protein [Clostridia bacterium]
MEKQSKNSNSSNRKKSGTKTAKKAYSASTILVSLLIVLLITCGIVGFCIMVYMISFKNGDLAIDLDSYKNNQNQTSILYATKSDKSVVEIARLHGEENRIWVKLDDAPENLHYAFIALEDKRFEKHGGVDWVRTISAVVKDHLKTGGSTITQQLIKNLTNENQVTFSRKFNEILYALNLEENYSKDEILEAYLNTIPLGSGCYGVQTAAKTYFGKDVSELNLAECAVLASITKAPTKYNPLINPDNNKERQETCLKMMYEQEYISEQEYNDAKNYKLIFTNSSNYVPSESQEEEQEQEADKKYQSYYVDYVIDTVIDDFMEQYGYDQKEAWRMVYYGGLKIYTSVDPDVQAQMESVYENRTTFPQEANKVEISADNTNEKVQSAMVIMDYNGRVVGVVGGAGPKAGNRSLNRAIDSPRQPGSSIKPLSVYAPAIEENLITWSKPIENFAIVVNGKRWPENYGGSIGSSGSYVSVQYAVAQSLNTVAARVVQLLTPQKCIEALTDKFHISTLSLEGKNNDINYSSMAVGGMTNGVTAIDMAAAYATFGNGGYYYKPYCYTKVTNNDGSVVHLENKQSGKRVLKSGTADVMNELMRTVITSGTGKGYGVTNFTTFAKTGTTSDNKDKWIVGGTPYYVAAVWYGYDKPQNITNVSGNPAGKIFSAVMNPIHKNLSEKEFVKSGETIQKTYCTKSGLLAGDSCQSTSTGWFKIDGMPGTCSTCVSSVPATTTESEQVQGASSDSGLGFNFSVSGNGVSGSAHFSSGN